MNQKALASKHTNEPELLKSSKGTRSVVVHPERLFRSKE
jgi:hypothetical protein